MKTAIPRATLALAALGVWLFSTAPVAAELKVGFVDQRRGLMSTDRGKEAFRSLEAMTEVKKQEMEPKQKEFLQLQEEFESQRFVLSQQALQERMLEIERRKRELERVVQAIQDEVRVQEVKLLRPVYEVWGKAISEIGEEQGFGLILERGTPGILYYQDALDITDLVVQRVNKQN